MSGASRSDDREARELRATRITPHFFSYAEGSVLIEMGKTRVACAVSIEDRVPSFLAGKGQGWLTAEYSMLPRATQQRTQRESARGRIGGRTHEIQRLIGRSLRPAIDLKVLGERTLTIDCDVLQADGGTRTASITGASVALALAVRRLMSDGTLKQNPLVTEVAAVSAGVVDGAILLDLAYVEDSRAETDCNVVMTAEGDLIEVQMTAERTPLARHDFDELLACAGDGIVQLIALQRAVLQEG